MSESGYRSPLKKLVRFFQRSRDRWKQKCQQAKYELKLLKRRFDNLAASRDHWQQAYQVAQVQIEQFQARSEHLQTREQQLQAQIDRLSKKN